MIEGIKHAYLKDFFLFKDLQESQLNQIASRVKIRQLGAGEVVNYGNGASSKIYFVVAGKVKVAEMDIENELVKDVLTSGEIFGDLQLEGNPKDFEFGQALTDNSIVGCIHTVDFMIMLESYPQVAVGYAKRMSQKLKLLEERHSDFMLHDVRSRLVRFIKNWARVDGSPLGDKMILPNYLTHSDIAGMISTSRQSVSTLLNEMRDLGMLIYNRKHIQINNWERWA